MSSQEIKFNKRDRLYPCIINKEDLIKLNELIINAFPNESDISFSISSNYRNATAKAKSIDDFFLINNLPIKLDNLDIQSFCNEKYIIINLSNSPYQHSLSLSGNDEAWVLGNFHRIKSFFDDKRPWFYSRKIVMLFWAIILGAMAPTAIYLFDRKYVITPICLSIFVILSYYIAIAGYWEKYLPYFELNILPKTKAINKDMAVIIIAILTLIATVIGGIILPLLSNH